MVSGPSGINPGSGSTSGAPGAPNTSVPGAPRSGVTGNECNNTSPAITDTSPVVPGRGEVPGGPNDITNPNATNPLTRNPRDGTQPPLVFA